MQNSFGCYAKHFGCLCKFDASIIAESGFETSKEVAQRLQDLEKITDFSLKRSENTGKVMVNIASLNLFGVVFYGCSCVKGQPLDNLSFITRQLFLPEGTPCVRCVFNKLRKKVFSNLKTGEFYYFYVFVINTVSVSPLRDIRKLMAA